MPASERGTALRGLRGLRGTLKRTRCIWRRNRARNVDVKKVRWILTPDLQRINLKRIYETADSKDGLRILVDRLWPRGVRKEDAHIDAWLKEVAPSPELRKWFHHDAQRFAEFYASYELELNEDPAHVEAVTQIVEWARHRQVTLVYAAKDPVHNHAVVLQNFLSKQLETS